MTIQIMRNNRKYFIIFCNKCKKRMEVRSDYISKHSGVCISCQKRKNQQAKKHGGYKTRLYKIWVGMKCRNYKTYKPKVCDEWQLFDEFRTWSMKNGYNDNLTIDRIDPKKDYSPENCQWITLEENSAKDKRIFTYEEKVLIYKERKKTKMTQREMAEFLGVSRNTIQRLEKELKK